MPSELRDTKKFVGIFLNKNIIIHYNFFHLDRVVIKIHDVPIYNEPSCLIWTLKFYIKMLIATFSINLDIKSELYGSMMIFTLKIC